MRDFSPRLIPYYGGKARLVPLYPAPVHQTICEPFAGGAAYSLAYAGRNVVLVEKYPLLVALWRYLIRVSPAEILALPLVQHIDDLPGSTPPEAKHLVGWWLNTCTTSPRKQASTRAKSGVRPNSFWGVKRRALISDQVTRIKHWKILEGDALQLRADRPDVTWFVDPPYQVAGSHYVHGSDGMDFSALGEWCKATPGQMIVCENAGADWLPFEHLAYGMSSSNMDVTSHEVVWIR